MTDFQKELIDELTNYALDYVKLGVHLHEQIKSLVITLDDKIANQDYQETTTKAIARYRQDWLKANNVIQTLKDERETWKSLITSFEDEEP